MPNRTASENHLIEQMRAAIASQSGDTEQAIKASQALIASGKLSEADRAKHAASLASLYYRNRDFANAAKWANEALKANGGDATMRSLMIQSYYQAGDLQAASREALADVQAAEKAGRAPPEDRLQLLANVASKGSDRGAYVQALERLVAYYPKREYWADLLRRIESKPGFSNRLTLDVYRLRLATKTLDTANDYSEAAQLALQQGQAAEGQEDPRRRFRRRRPRQRRRSGPAEAVADAGSQRAQQTRRKTWRRPKPKARKIPMRWFASAWHTRGSASTTKGSR